MRYVVLGLCGVVGLVSVGWGIKELIFLRAAWGWVVLGMMALGCPWIGAFRGWYPARLLWRRLVLGGTGVLWGLVLVGVVHLGLLHYAVRDQAMLEKPMRTSWGTIQDQVFSAEGHTSSYRLFLPERRRMSRPTGLVMFLHGAGFTGRIYERWLAQSFYPKAQELGWLVVFPSAGSGEDMVRRLWNDGSRPETTKALGIPQQRPWLRGLVSLLCKTYQIDPKMVFWAGHSNGAAMVMSVAALEKQPFGGVVAISGAISAERLAQKPVGSPLPVLLVHGEKDALIPSAGRRSGKKQVFVPTRETLAYWAEHNGCVVRKEGPFTGIRPPETEKAGGIDILFYPKRCKHSTLLWSFRQGGHMLPGVPLEKAMAWLLMLGMDGRMIAEVKTADLVLGFFVQASLGRTFEFLEDSKKTK